MVKYHLTVIKNDFTIVKCYLIVIKFNLRIYNVPHNCIETTGLTRFT